jgi:signal transduction histidine kinase
VATGAAVGEHPPVPDRRAADEAQRRVRDLHDGAQQRLVHTIVTLNLAPRDLGVLTHGGVRAGVTSLVARLDLSVEVDVPA